MTSTNAKHAAGGRSAVEGQQRRNQRERRRALSLVPPSHSIADHAKSAAKGPHGTAGRRLGTKSGVGVFHTIINQMPPHRVYIEPFLGWGSIMKAKLPADRNIGIDINGDRVRALRLERHALMAAIQNVHLLTKEKIK